jgi:hypothetical protein
VVNPRGITDRKMCTARAVRRYGSVHEEWRRCVVRFDDVRGTLIVAEGVVRACVIHTTPSL